MLDEKVFFLRPDPHGVVILHVKPFIAVFDKRFSENNRSEKRIHRAVTDELYKVRRGFPAFWRRLD